MKTRICISFYLLLSTLFNFKANGQSFVLYDSSNVIINNGDTLVVTGDTSVMMIAQVNVQNISSIGKTVVVEKTVLSAVPLSTNYFSWGFYMYDTSAVISQGQLVGAGVLEPFQSSYISISNFGSSWYRYKFFDQNNPADSAWLVIEFRILNVTSVEENILNNISIFPNPGAGLFHLILPSSFKADYSLKIFNSTGRLVMKKDFDESDLFLVIDLEKYPDGIYFLRIDDEIGFLYKNLKIVKG